MSKQVTLVKEYKGSIELHTGELFDESDDFYYLTCLIPVGLAIPYSKQIWHIKQQIADLQQQVAERDRLVEWHKRDAEVANEFANKQQVRIAEMERNLEDANKALTVQMNERMRLADQNAAMLPIVQAVAKMEHMYVNHASCLVPPEDCPETDWGYRVREQARTIVQQQEGQTDGE